MACYYAKQSNMANLYQIREHSLNHPVVALFLTEIFSYCSSSHVNYLHSFHTSPIPADLGKDPWVNIQIKTYLPEYKVLSQHVLMNRNMLEGRECFQCVTCFTCYWHGYRVCPLWRGVGDSGVKLRDPVNKAPHTGSPGLTLVYDYNHFIFPSFELWNIRFKLA